MATRLKPLGAPTLDKKIGPANKRQRHHGKDPGYLEWLHALPCCVTGRRDEIEAHHPTVGRGRMARKEDDSTAVPVTRSYHSDQYPTGLHRGEAKFWNLHAIDPSALADDLFAVYQSSGYVTLGADFIREHRELAKLRKLAGVKIFEEKLP